MLGETCHLNDDNALPYLQATVAELLSLWMVPISSLLLLVWCIRRQASNMRGTVLRFGHGLFFNSLLLVSNVR
jgi:hypothetical protein